MRLNIDVAMDCRLTLGDAVLLILEATDGDGQAVVEATLDIENTPVARKEGQTGLVWAFPESERFKLRYHATVDVTRAEVPLAGLAATPLHALPGNVFAYLRPSRLCQSDLFEDFAQQQFGEVEGGAKILAIRDWVAAEIAYVEGSSHGATTAVDTFSSRQGVCRDFAHLVCALARAAQIPARYTSVYGADVSPPDFHAVGQVWLDGAWHLIDATGMGAVSQMAVIASGRDASEVAFMETENWAQPLSQSVSVQRA